MQANEQFLDTAIKTSSIGSLSKMLGYIPKSRKSAKTTVEIQNTSSSTVSVVRGDSVLSANSVNWYSWEAGLTLAAGATADLTCYAGSRTPVIDVQAKILTETPADTNTLLVKVKEGGITNTYSKSDNIVSGLTGDDRVYFLDMTYDGFYRVGFGDGIFGRKVADDAQVFLSYVVAANGPDENGISTFSSTNSNLKINKTVDSSAGGSLADTIADVKFYAPGYFQSQNRAVTVGDYDVLLKDGLASVTSLSIWGGEENRPPQYGRVFISSTSSSDIDVQDLLGAVKSKSVVSIIPEYVPANTIQLFISPEEDPIFYYDSFATSKTSEQLKQQVKTYLDSSYGLGLLGQNFDYLKYTESVNDLETGLVGNKINVILAKNITDSSLSGSYLIDFGNAFESQARVGNPRGKVIYSSPIVVEGYSEPLYIRNDGEGITLYRLEGEEEVIVEEVIGTFNSETGVIYIRDLQSVGPFTVYVEPASTTIISSRNVLLSVNNEYTSRIKMVAQ